MSDCAHTFKRRKYIWKLPPVKMLKCGFWQFSSVSNKQHGTFRLCSAQSIPRLKDICSLLSSLAFWRWQLCSQIIFWIHHCEPRFIHFFIPLKKKRVQRAWTPHSPNSHFGTFSAEPIHLEINPLGTSDWNQLPLPVAKPISASVPLAAADFQSSSSIIILRALARPRRPPRVLSSPQVGSRQQPRPLRSTWRRAEVEAAGARLQQKLHPSTGRSVVSISPVCSVVEMWRTGLKRRKRGARQPIDGAGNISSKWSLFNFLLH